MTTLADLKRKYSGQKVPDWELEAAGLLPKPEAPKKTKTEPVKNVDSPADSNKSPS